VCSSDLIVRIVAAAREPGARSKIAVTSRDSDVDPVGACVDMKGSRVQAVVQELRGEKIDIVPFDRDPARFVCNAIAPAEVVKVIIDEANGSMELVVPDDKLSLAIGRRGQNVRLASQLTGWKLDVIGESKFKQMEDEAIDALASIDGIDDIVAKALYKQGFRSVDEITEAADNELAAISALGGPANAAAFKQRAERAMEKLRTQRLQAAISGDSLLTDKETLSLVKGVSSRVADLLYQAGYRSVDDVARETDVDRLAIRTGLGMPKVKAITEGVAAYLASDGPRVEQGQQAARKRQQAQAPVEAEAAPQAPVEADKESAGA
jgi:N utilization substance protein A